MIKKQPRNRPLLELIEEKQLFPQRFLCTLDDYFVYSESDYKIKKVSLVYRKFNIMRSSKYFLNRGKLLEDILIIEYLLSQIIFIKKTTGEIIFFDYKKIKELNANLDNITFKNKIELIEFCELLNQHEREILDKIRQFRNKLAHSLSDLSFEYNKKPIKDNFEEFESDFYAALNILVKINNHLWKKYDIENKTIDWIEKNLNKD